MFEAILKIGDFEKKYAVSFDRDGNRPSSVRMIIYKPIVAKMLCHLFLAKYFSRPEHIEVIFYNTRDNIYEATDVIGG